MSVYRETIQALKDFTEAKKRLDKAEEKWDRILESLETPPGGGMYAGFFFLKSQYVGEVAQEFYSAKRAYDQLGKGFNNPFDRMSFDKILELS